MSTAIVLAGGLGTRLKSITNDLIPKPMVDVQGKPFLHWLMRYLRFENITHVILATGYKSEVISDYIGNSYEKMKISYSFEQNPLGTGGAIRKALSLSTAEDVYIINGDTYFPIDLWKLMRSHKSNKNDITIAIKLMHGFDRYGSISLSAKNELEAFNEKKWMDTGFINGGIYVVNKKCLEQFQIDTTFSLEKEIFENKIHHLKIGIYKSKAQFIDIGIPEDYGRIQNFHLK